MFMEAAESFVVGVGGNPKKALHGDEKATYLKKVPIRRKSSRKTPYREKDPSQKEEIEKRPQHCDFFVSIGAVASTYACPPPCGRPWLC